MVNRKDYNISMVKNQFTLDKLEVFQLSKQLSKVAWKIFENFNWSIKKIVGDQYIEATDSVGANISEGYGRFHYLDRIKFLYNARGSLFESKYWFDLLIDRKILTKSEIKDEYIKIFNELSPKLNGLINSIYKNRMNFPNNK